MKRQKINLWENEVPLLKDGQEVPYMTYYPSSDKRADGTVVICPGGGYVIRAPHEGEGYAEFLNAHGMDAFVLEYRVAPYRHPTPLLDARRAIRYVRANATKFGINPDKIAIMGSSAGAHLSALTCTYRGKIDGEGADELDKVDYLPNMQILCYPVIEHTGHLGSFKNLLGDKFDEKWESVTPSIIADKKTPPAFIWHTFEDETVNIQNTYNYAKKLKEFNIVTEMHIYPFGRHGLGLDPQNEVPYIHTWGYHLIDWLKLNNYYL